MSDATGRKGPAGGSGIEREAMFGVLPVTADERLYGFLDAFLVLSGYCIATWSYTQGSYLATLVGFRQLLIGAFLGAVLMLAVYQLPVILSVRFGMDIWVWLRAAFGPVGILIMTVATVAINYPWYAVCGDLFASSMMNLVAFAGLRLPQAFHTLLAVFCVAAGTFIAYKGLGAITWTTRILVPLLFAVGAVVVAVGFSSVPLGYIMDYRPPRPEGEPSVIPYVMSVEANFAFVITLVGGMAEIPRVAKSERGGYWAGVLGQGLAGSFFVVVGAVMAIAMQYVCGRMVDDPTVMLATLATPALALCSLLLVAFANIGTQAVGAYIYGVMLRSAFRRVGYNTHIALLALYGILFCIWGRIIEYFGSFLTISACIYAPLAAILFADFFFVRRQKIDLRAAYGMKGHEDVYRFTGGVNLVGMASVVLGVAVSLAIYNPVTAAVHIPALFLLTPTGVSFLATLAFYWGMSLIPPVRSYMLGRNPRPAGGADASFAAGSRRKEAPSLAADSRDYRSSLTTRKGRRMDPTPFDSVRTPPRQNLFLLPLMHLACFFCTARYALKIRKENMAGIKPPYLLLGSHHSFMDFFVTPLAVWPHRANYISELEGFEAFGEWIYRQAGCLGTRKFISDLPLVRNIQKVVGRGDIIVIYPEARYSNVGTNSKLTPSVAKLARLLGLPVVTLVMNGNHLQSPIWNLAPRTEVRLRATLKCVLTPGQVRAMSAKEILAVLQKELTYDDYRYQRETGLRITFPRRAEGLHLPLYMCRSCGGEFCMGSRGARLYCTACGAAWEMDEYGTLQPLAGTPASGGPLGAGADAASGAGPAASETPLPAGGGLYIPDYYEWERRQVVAEIGRGGYRFDRKVRVEALPNAKNFIALGEGRLVHDAAGFRLTFRGYREAGEKTLFFPAASSPSIHTEYDYRGEGQCVALSTPSCTYFLFPLEEGFNATKIQFATECFFERAAGS